MMRFIRISVLVLAGLLVALFVLAIVIPELTRDHRAETASRIVARIPVGTSQQAQAAIMMRAMIGQALVCGAPENEILKAMNATASMVAVFTSKSAAADEAGNYAFTQGGDLQKDGRGAPPCSEVLAGFEKMRSSFKAQGLN
ncbi:hypothetical protein [Methylobacterium sp. CM6247]